MLPASTTTDTVDGTLRWRNGIPEIRPLETVEELLSWQPTEGQSRLCQSSHPLPARRDGGLRANRPRLLCCHDHRGNYLEDRLLQGGSDAGAYVFRHWHAIDGFVYFSHNLVTVPPPGWTDAAHLHGVPILGTLITEWEQGTATMTALLASDATAERAANQLATLAAFLGFDGWIVNIENDIHPSRTPRLLHFLTCLTTAMHAAVPHSGTVVWYDAVTIHGVLEWQNTLNALNAPFFDVCDGIWINYTWERTTPAAVTHHLRQGSSGGTTAHHSARKYDVYMGVDAFGRGSYGGGGLGCPTALTAARSEGLSVALFACAWPFEKYQEYDVDGDQGDVDGDAVVVRVHASPHATAKSIFTGTGTGRGGGSVPSTGTGTCTAWHARDDEFWSVLVKSWGVNRAVVCSLPMFTDFCEGAGGGGCVQAGVVTASHPWYNLALQSLQPSISWRGRRPRDVEVGITTAASFNGGSSLFLVGSVAGSHVLRLFRAAAPLSRSTLHPGLKIRFAVAASAGLQVFLVLRLRKMMARKKKGGGGGGVDNKDDDEDEFDPGGESKEANELVLEMGSGGSSKSTGAGTSSLATPNNAAVVQKLSTNPMKAPLTWLPTHNNDKQQFNGIPYAHLPKEWATSQFSIGPADVDGWKLESSAIVSIELAVTPKSPGTACPCNVLVGAVGVWNVDEPAPGWIPASPLKKRRQLSVSSVMNLMAVETTQHSAGSGGREEAVAAIPHRLSRKHLNFQ